MKKIVNSLCIVTLLCVFSLILNGSRVAATGTANIVEMFVEDDNIILYVKGIGSEVQSAEGYIASERVENISYSNLSKADIPIKTLVLIDTSLSIKEAEQEHFIELLINLIDKKTVNESFAIASYGEKIDYKCDYNSDRWELIKSLDDIEYRKQKTYLVEILYDLISEFEASKEDCFYRIIVFSDGADSNDTGVTINELSTLLQKSPYPIYSIGSEYNSNTDELKELFSISRITNANYSSFTSESNLEEVEKVIDVIDNYTRIEIKAPKELQDGSIKNIRLEIGTLDTTYTLSGDIRMNMYINKAEEDSVIMEDIDDVPVDAKDKEEDTYDDNKKNSYSTIEDPKAEGVIDKIKGISSIIYVFVALAVVVIILVIFVVITLKNWKKRNRANKNINSMENKKSINMSSNSVIESEGRTEMLFNINPTEQRDTGTQYLFAPESRTRIKLKDISNNQIYEKYVDGIINIGRSHEKNVIAITKEPSVSSEHCKIYLQGTDVYIEDKNSSNHTLVNNSKIDIPTIIRTGDTITLGRITLEVTIFNV